MRSLQLVVVAILVGSLGAVSAGCSESGASTDGREEADVKAAAKPASVGGLFLGTYKNKFPLVGELLSMELKARTPGMPRKFDGAFSRVDKTSSGEKRLEGSFTIQKRTIKSNATVSGTTRLPILSFFDAKGVLIDELVAIPIDVDIAMSKPGGDEEFFLTLEKTASGETAVTVDLDCEVTDVDQSLNPFEEGLVAKGDGDEDSSVVRIEETLGELRVQLGQVGLSNEGGDKLTVLSRAGRDIDIDIDASSGEKIHVVVKSDRGTMEIGSGSAKKRLGAFTCSR
jgi:hypothetical protein